MAKLAVDTKFAKFAVLTSKVKTIVERYPAVPRPITVDVSCVGLTMGTPVIEDAKSCVVLIEMPATSDPVFI